MNNVAEFLKRASEKTGFNREFYDDSKTPTHQSNIAIIPFFGDIRSTMILSSFLLKRYKEEVKGSKYFILATWPGHRHLFPYVDEFWSLANDNLEDLYKSAHGFENTGKLSTIYCRNLNLYFEDVVMPSAFGEFYENGFKKEFFSKFKVIKRSLPNVPSLSILGQKFATELRQRAGLKVFLHPSKWICCWNRGKTIKFPYKREFWISLVNRMIQDGFVPVVHSNYLTHDISPDFTNKCIYIPEADLSKVMGAMRAVGCVLDVFSEISRISLMARCPFVAVLERNKFAGMKDYELDDLCEKELPKQYIFTFPTIIDNGNEHTWNLNLFNGIMQKLTDFIPLLDINTLPSTTESTVEVSYDVVRKKKMTRMGAKFIKVPREESLDG